jgi:uncharacterized protein YdhG (YjbR/CyaY superfamily)
MSPLKEAEKSTRSGAAGSKTGKGFTAEERAAMKARVKELKASADKAEAEAAVVEVIDKLSEPDRSMGKRLFAIIKASAPSLSAQLWYGMPAFYKDGKLICHFQPAAKFKTRYATIGFSDKANIDEGAMWPVAYALGHLTTADEAKIIGLVKRAIS